jgi:chlorobactene glucosyltransferase
MRFVLINLAIVLFFRLGLFALGRRTLGAFSISTIDADRRPTSPPSSISVLIPARNEEKNIGSCLDSVLRQDFPIAEIIVIDDGSTDRTGRIVQDRQREHEIIRLVRNNELPPGWLGKNYALHRGAQHARGDYLLFLDADVRLSPDCLRRAMGHVIEYDSDLTTMLPVVQCVGFWEKVILPVYGKIFLWSLVPMLRPWNRLAEHRPPKPIAFGGFLLFKRSTYDEIGGHERVRQSIIEDIDLARVITWDGHKLSVLFGWPAFFTARMYFHVRHIWEGISKSLSGLKIWQLILGAYGMFILLVLPWLAIPAALLHQWRYGWDSVSAWVLALGIVLSAVALLSRWILARVTRIDNTYPYLEPLGGLMMVAMLIGVVFKLLMGKGAHWKGRHVSLNSENS